MRTQILILAISIFFSPYFAQAQYTKLHSFSGSTDGKYPWASLYNDGTHLYGMTGEGGPDNDGTIFKLKKDGTGFQTILNFKNADNGRTPYGSLISDGTYLYGLTYSGAGTNFGTIFRIFPDGTGYTKLHEFNGTNGRYLYNSLVTDGSFIYGMTFAGGSSTTDLGSIFKLKTDGTSFSTLLVFDGSSNGQNPVGDLLLIGSTLYGTTSLGGANNVGTIFRINTDGTGYSKTHDFVSTTGSTPYGALVTDGSFLYGMTYNGGANNLGTIYRIAPDGASFTKLLDFNGTGNGANPYGSLKLVGSFFYGMTAKGGNNGMGTLFRIKPDGSSYTKLLDFNGPSGNGSFPWGSLIADGNDLYGVTSDEENDNGVDEGTDYGTVFKYSPSPFITQWNLATAGSGATQLSIGTATSGVVNYTWQQLPSGASGSGSWSGANLTITGLPTGATIRLQIAPTNFQRIIMSSGADRNRLTQVEQWGSTVWTSMESSFQSCTNLQITATDVPDLSGVASMASMFRGCSNLNSPSNIGSWNTAAVTDMQRMFESATSFNQDIGAWNTGAVTNMYSMFYQANAFNQNIGAWNTGAVTNMEYMFYSADVFNQNIGAWNTSSVITMSETFSQAAAFNQNISAWNTTATTTMFGMFSGATAFNQNIGAWNLNPVVDLRNMFSNSGMDCTNYSNTIILWSANPSTPNGRTLGATGRQYGTNAVGPRTNLTSNKSWTITGDSPSTAVCGSPSITITQQPVNPNNRCEGLNFTFSTDAIGTTNITFQWQKFNTGTSLFENLSDNATYSGTNTKNLLITNVQLAQGGDYRCMIQGDLAPTVYCNTGTLTVNPLPAAPLVSNGTRCGNGQVLLSASGTSDGNYIWYGSNGLSEPIAGENNSTYLTPFITATTTYYVSIVNSVCESALVPVDAIITPGPAAPTVTNVTNDGCGTQSFTLSATSASAGDFSWYQTPTATSPIETNSTGTYVTADLSSTTTYYVSFSQSTCESNRVPQTITITNPGPGFIDNTFSPAANSPGNWSAIDDMVLQPDGKFVLNYFETAGVEYLMCRLLPNGTLDPSFTQRPRTLFTGRPDVVTLQSDGKILSGGRFTVIDGTSYGRIIRLNTDGSVDGTFSTGSGFNDNVGVITQQSDNKIIIGGSFTSYAGGGANRIIRINDNGTRDTGFIIGTGFNAEVKVIIVRADGKILVGGSFTAYNGSIVSGIILLNTDGTIDNTFASTGLTNVREIALQSDGKILLDSNEGFTRLNTDGTVDTSFNIGSGFDAAINSIYCEPSGKILVGGDFQAVDGATRYFVARLNPDGSLDQYFNTGIGSFTWVYEILPAGTNQVFVAGYFDFWNNVPQNGIARINNACIRTPIAFDNSSCGPSITLSACGGFNGDYRWYTTATGGTPIAGETNSSITITNLTATTTYYVTLNDGVCESTRVPVVATSLSPAAPTVTGASSCSGGAFTLTASGGTNGQYRWYTVASGGTPIAGETNSTYTTVTITSSTTYYVSIDNGSCESSRTAVTASIITAPTAPTVTGGVACGPSASVTLTANGGTNGEYRWYTAATGGTAITGEVNSTYATPSITATTTYYIAINNGTCESTRTSVIATINALPAKPAITLSGSAGICSGQSITLSAPAGFTYQWSNGATTQQITVNAAGSFTVQVNNGTCSSVSSDPAVITIITCNQPPVISTTTATTVVEGSVTINLSTLLSDPDNNLDLSTLKIVVPPSSGAIATIIGQNLVINYAGINFGGTDRLTIEICDVAGVCVQQELSIEVGGDIIAYNGVSNNGDNKNAIFLLKYIDSLPDTKENKVTIYNRWGDVVWEGVNYDNTNVVFTGQNKNGNDLPTGTYFYKIEFTSGKSSVTGYLSLKR